MRYETDDHCPIPTDDELSLQRAAKRGLFLALLLIIVSMALSLALSTRAHAQTITRQATISWTAPTLCKGGAPLTNCPITGYSVQKLSGTTWNEVGTTTAAVLSFVHRDLAIGTHTYRVLATSSSGPSDPSNEVTKIIDVPGAPGGIVITVTITVTP